MDIYIKSYILILTQTIFQAVSVADIYMNCSLLIICSSEIQGVFLIFHQKNLKVLSGYITYLLFHNKLPQMLGLRMTNIVISHSF